MLGVTKAPGYVGVVRVVALFGFATNADGGGGLFAETTLRPGILFVVIGSLAGSKEPGGRED